MTYLLAHFMVSWGKIPCHKEVYNSVFPCVNVNARCGLYAVVFLKNYYIFRRWGLVKVTYDN